MVMLVLNLAKMSSLTLDDQTASRMLVVCDAPVTGDIRLEFRLDPSRSGGLARRQPEQSAEDGFGVGELPASRPDITVTRFRAV